MRWDAAQEAKWRLGIEREVEIVLIDTDSSAYAWTRMENYRPDEATQIFIRRDLHPEFANFCLWHELAHVRQLEWEYGGDGDTFLREYHRAAILAGLAVSEDGFLVTHRDPFIYGVLPWEAEANLTAWENRMTLLTRRGRGTHEYGPQGTWWYFRDHLQLDTDEIMDIGNQYREGMRNE